MVGRSGLLSGNSFYALLLESAREEGFPLAGALDLDRAGEAFSSDVERYDRWIQAGYAGAMSYLERGRDRRADPRLVFPGAQSILCVGIPYRRLSAGSDDPQVGPRFARYLEGRDYHDRIAERLEALMKKVSERARAQGLSVPQWKVCVDTSAVLERSWAALAGLGWIGKNTLLIHPKLGSYFFIGSVLIDQLCDIGPQPLPDYCGNCVRCQEACPTSAFVEERVLDSRRCISYLTLEKRGDYEAPGEVTSKMGTWVAGCDICQEVCPFNRRAVKEAEEAHASGDQVEIDLGPLSQTTWEALMRETDDEYRARVKGTALSRIKPAEFRRNLMQARKNSGLE